MDPLQFAHQPGVEVDDAVGQSSVSPGEAGEHCKTHLFIFFSAFNTIQLSLKDKLECVDAGCHLSNWILDYLTHWPGTVCLIRWSAAQEPLEEQF